MQKVISINLNGNAFQLEEGGYDALQEYLATAERELKDNPDRAEIVSDLEQAIADKCQKYLAPHKTVITAAEVAQIVAEMGPVASGAGTESGEKNGTGAKQGGTTSVPPPPKRLYRIPDGAMIAGVCTGLGAYFQIDVTLIRIGFVVLALLTKGVGILVYIAMMFLVPEANTPEERAAAGGVPFNAREVVDRVKRQYEQGSRHWNRQWRRKQRRWRRAAWSGAAAVPPPLAWTAAIVPLFGLVHLILFLIAAAMMISLVNRGAILNWQVPPDMPLWAAALMLFFAYQIVVSPFRAAQHWRWHPAASAAGGWLALWATVTWLIGLAIVLWVASSHVPEIGEFMLRVPHLFREFMYAVRDFFRE
jgi:phage shock protein PspC (stress-responsive transcriptional regulator)